MHGEDIDVVLPEPLGWVAERRYMLPSLSPAAGRLWSRSPSDWPRLAEGGAAPRAAAGPWQEATGTGRRTPSFPSPVSLPGAVDVVCCRRPAPGEGWEREREREPRLWGGGTG